MRSLILAIAVLFAFIVAISSVQAADTPAPAKALVKERCVKCHTLKRVGRYVEKKPGEAWWESTLTRMQGHGARLSPEEKGLIVGFLAKDATAKDF